MGLIAAGVGFVYVMFFSKLLEIRDISFNGLNTVSPEEFEDKINARLDQKIFGYLSRRNNLLLGVDSDNLEKEISSSYPIFKSVKVQKNLPHNLVFSFEERKPVGIWCVANECRYFDNEMQTWGPAVRSSGFLMLTVSDERSGGGEFNIDKDFFDAILQASSDASTHTIRSVGIPEGSFNEFRVYTDQSFYIIYSLDSSVKDQSEILSIFLKEKSKDSNFQPQYIDLRIEGRIYFK